MYGTWLSFALCFPFAFGLIVTILIDLIGIALIWTGRIFYKCPPNYDDSRWGNLRGAYYRICLYLGKIWHGYEVEGMKNLPHPQDGGALIVVHHGTAHFEFVFFMSYLGLHRTQKFRVIGDRCFFWLPILRERYRFANFTPGTYSEVVRLLREGYLVLVAPGGGYEAQMTNTYELLWGKRSGFARAAIEAKVPIVPLFTKNCKEVFRNLHISKRLHLWIYQKIKYPMVPPYGGFPVKLRAYVGDSIPYDPTLTAEELVEKARHGLKTLMDKHQRIPGSITMALLDRFCETEKSKAP